MNRTIDFIMVSLDAEQEALAAKYGAEMHAYAKSKGYRQAGANFSDEEHLSNDIMGFRGEISLADFLNLPWRPNIGTFGDADVGGFVEIRTRRITKKNPEPQLSVFPKENESRPMVLARAWENGVIELCGWMMVADAKKVGKWHGVAKTLFVEAEHYRSLDELLPLVQGWKRNPQFKTWLDKGPYHKFQRG